MDKKSFKKLFDKYKTMLLFVVITILFITTYQLSMNDVYSLMNIKSHPRNGLEFFYFIQNTAYSIIFLVIILILPSNEDIDYIRDKAKKEYATTLNGIQNVYLNIVETTDELLEDQKDKEYSILFLDIFQNSTSNEIIMKHAQLYIASPKEEYKQAIDVISSVYNELITKYFKEGISKTRSIGLPNFDVTIVYADKWGEIDDSGDYTTVISQMLNVRGLGQNDTGNANTGCWYRSESQRSVSWYNAQIFERYMDISGTASSLDVFYHMVHVGVFIGSANNDGKLNHLAFVTAKSYRNLRIALHLKGYHAWTRVGTCGRRTCNNYRMIMIIPLSSKV